MKTKTALALAASLVGLSHGATVLTVDKVYNGATPSADAPWATITATTVDTRANGALADVVNINILASPDVTGTEFISKLALTLNEELVNADTVVSLEAIQGWWNGPLSTEVDVDNIIVGGGDRLDLGVEFLTTNQNGGGFRFKEGKSFDLRVSYTGSEDITDENIFGDNAEAVIHVQGINGGDSGWATNVPEPDVSLLLGGVAMLGLLRRRK